MDRTITLIRHGKTKGNLEKRYIGITDEALSSEGIKSIEDRDYPEADIVFSSPLIRCIQTAKIIYPKNKIHIIEDLRETDFGLFEGKSYKYLENNLDYQKWIDSNGKIGFPGGETQKEAIERSLNGFDRLLHMSESYNKVTAIVHGGTIMAILSRIFNDDYYSYHVENGEGYTFDLSHNGIYSGLCPRSFFRRS